MSERSGTKSRLHSSTSADGPPRDDGDVPPPMDAFKSAGRSLSEFQAYFGHYIAAKSDLIKLSIRKLLTMAVLGIVALLVGATMLATAGVLVLVGLSNWIAAIFTPPKPWVGQIIVGAVVLGGSVLLSMWAIRRLTGTSLLRTVARYESKRADQRAHFGEDVSDRAGESPNSGQRTSQN